MAAKLKDTIFDELKLQLSLGKGKASLSVGVRENCPFMLVRTKVEGDTNNGLIEAAMEPKTFYALMEMIRSVARNNGPTLVSIDNKSNFIAGKYNPQAQVVSRTTVQKKEDGVTYISITAGSRRPVIEFPFTSDEYHNFVNDQGQPLSGDKVSRYAAVGQANMWEKLMANVLAKHYRMPEWLQKKQAQNGQGGQQGGYQQGGRGQGGGGYQQQPAQSGGDMFDEDIPF